MVDPRKLHSFLQRSVKAMEAAGDNGDADGVLRYERLMDQANAEAQRFISQQPPPQAPPVAAPAQMGQEVAPPPVGGGQKLGGVNPNPPARQRDARGNVVGLPEPQFPPAPMGDPLAAPPEVNMPPGTGGMNMLNDALQKASGANRLPGPSPYDPVVGSAKQFGPAPMPPKAGMQSTNTPSRTNTARAEGSFGPMGQAFDPFRQVFGLEPGVDDASQTPDVFQSVKLGDSVEGPPVQAPDDPMIAAGKQDSDKLALIQSGLASPADSVEQEALTRIQKELGQKPEAFSLENLMMLLLIGAPNTLRKIMGENSEYNRGVRDIYNRIRSERSSADRNKVTDEFRNRQLEALEASTVSREGLNDAKVTGMKDDEARKDAREIIRGLQGQAPDMNNPLHVRALQIMGIPMPPVGK